MHEIIVLRLIDLMFDITNIISCISCKGFKITIMTQHFDKYKVELIVEKNIFTEKMLMKGQCLLLC